MNIIQRYLPNCILVFLSFGCMNANAQPADTLDLLAIGPTDNIVHRVYGSTGTGTAGVPVTGGFDTDGDGHRDYAVAYFQADRPGVLDSGEVNLVFGDGAINGFVDSSVNSSRLLRVLGEEMREFAGSEIWMDDVNGDGLGDLLVCRQNYSLGGLRSDTGALSIVFGRPALRTLASSGTALDLAMPDVPGEVLTIVGANVESRFCIWTRTGDVDNDGVVDILVGADTENGGAAQSGASYLIRGGAHLTSATTVDLANFGTTGLAGNVMRILPHPAANLRFGGTVQLADLDANNRAELLIAGTLNRAGAALDGSGAGGSVDGTAFIVWDDVIPVAPWPAGFEVAFQNPAATCSIVETVGNTSAGSCTRIEGENANDKFGEELLGGLDYNGDGLADLFIGDITGTGINGINSGIGYIFFEASDLKNRDFDLQTPPASLKPFTRIDGASSGDISADTAAHGDFNGDGLADLAYASPHASPQGRIIAGAVHILFGQLTPWPSFIDLANIPDQSVIRMTEIQGANGSVVGDIGDTLAYSAAAADINNDGKTDLITNEMVGNGIASGTIDVGNLIIVSGAKMQPSTPSLQIPVMGWVFITALFGLMSFIFFRHKTF